MKEPDGKQVEQTILAVVNSSNGIKFNNLLTKLYHGLKLEEYVVDGDDLVNLIQTMVSANMIVEVSYTTLDQRQSSFILPKGSSVSISTNKFGLGQDQKPKAPNGPPQPPSEIRTHAGVA